MHLLQLLLGKMGHIWWSFSFLKDPARAETFPNTVLEALACGTSVVATAVGGIPEQIKNGVNGFLVAASDSEEMAARIEQLLSDNDQWLRLGA